MQKIKVVIGAGWGDEGKGLMTDALSSFHDGDCTVVRFNGGAQAGHTVVTPEGQRHVFGHFGAGSFTGAATYLSKYFIVNPLLFMKEYALLNKIRLPILVHPDAIVTTPYDMMMNHLFQKKRNWHGSCGVGINETVTRNSAQFPLSVRDLYSKNKRNIILQDIRTKWVPARLEMLDIKLSKNQMEIFNNDTLLKQWHDDAEHMLSLIDTFTPELSRLSGNIIFEGAQGLMLDEFYGKFPYVTRSSTGLKNVIKMLKEMDESNFEVIYMTRIYATRHGAGPLPNELTHKPYHKIVDNTNIRNEYQGSLRFGYLDLDTLINAIGFDLNTYTAGLKPKVKIAVTCLDQIDKHDDVIFSFSNQNANNDSSAAPSVSKLYRKNADDLLSGIAWKAVNNGIPELSLITSNGPTRKTLRNFELVRK